MNLILSTRTKPKQQILFQFGSRPPAIGERVDARADRPRSKASLPPRDA
jgi:hypothetical protein